MGRRGRIYNTFDAHRLLHWAEGRARQLALKEKLFEAYFTEGEDPEQRTRCCCAWPARPAWTSSRRARHAGIERLSPTRCARPSTTGSAPASVRCRRSIINERHLISGGQPPEVFEQALRQIAQQDEELEQDEAAGLRRA